MAFYYTDAGGTHDLTDDLVPASVFTDNTLWTWGRNNYGQLGLSDATDRKVPTRSGTLSNWKVADAADPWGGHLAAIKTDGTLWTCGYNNHGQLGFSDTTNRVSLTQVGSSSNWKNVKCGKAYTIAQQTDGTLWSCGYNYNGQLGKVTGDLSTFAQISTTLWKTYDCGYSHTVAVRSDNTLWSWGNNLHGQLGLSDYIDRHTPTQVGASTNWKQAAAGTYHTAAIKTDGTLWTGGYNQYYQLGITSNRADIYSLTQVDTSTNWKQVACGQFHTLAIKTNGTLWGCGDNSQGQLGLSDINSRSTFMQIGSLTNWKNVVCGTSTSAIKTDGSLWVAGNNTYGQLGLSNTVNLSTFTQVGTQTNWKSIFVGLEFVGGIQQVV